jgi:hypothetical protein
MGWITVWNNTAVHVIMYWYFARSALGHYIWWRSHITTFQILQFVSDFLTSLPYIPIWYNGVPCHGKLSVWCAANFVGFSLFGLFVHFAINDKRRPGSKAAKKDKANKSAAATNGTNGSAANHDESSRKTA